MARGEGDSAADDGAVGVRGSSEPARHQNTDGASSSSACRDSSPSLSSHGGWDRLLRLTAAAACLVASQPLYSAIHSRLCALLTKNSSRHCCPACGGACMAVVVRRTSYQDVSVEGCSLPVISPASPGGSSAPSGATGVPVKPLESAAPLAERMMAMGDGDEGRGRDRDSGGIAAQAAAPRASASGSLGML